MSNVFSDLPDNKRAAAMFNQWRAWQKNRLRINGRRANSLRIDEKLSRHGYTKYVDYHYRSGTLSFPNDILEAEVLLILGDEFNV